MVRALIFDALGDPGVPARTILNRTQVPVTGEVSLVNLEGCLGPESARSAP